MTRLLGAATVTTVLALGGCNVQGSNQPLTLVEQRPAGATTVGAPSSTSTGGGQGNGGASGGSIGPGGTGESGGGACSAPPLSSVCSQDTMGPLMPQTMEEYTAAISGRWLLCGNHESVFAVDGGDIGLEITPDHHFYKLYPAQGGATIRGAGAGEEGTWSSLGVSQLNLQVAGIEYGLVITAPVLTSTPRTMYLDNNGVFRGTYVIDASVPTGASRCPKGVDLTRSGACTPPPDSMTVCTDNTPNGFALGQWSRCGGTMPGAPAHDGIEFAADGTFYFLHLAPAGGLVRGTAATDHGTASFEPGVVCQENVSLQTLSGSSWLSGAQFL